MKTYRRVKYWTGVAIEKGLCFKWDGENNMVHFDGSRTGFFHSWGFSSGESVAIVESMDGDLHLVDPSFIKFTYSDSVSESLNEMLHFIDDEENRQRVIDIIFKMKE